jgi:hypothetical protein
MGGLNANLIFQAAQPAPVNDFGKMYQAAQQQKQQKAMQAAALQSQQLEAQEKQIQLQNAQANQVQQQGVLQALQGSQGDVNAAIEILKKQGNPQAFVLEKHKSEAEKATAELGKVQQEIATSKQKQQAENLNHVASLTSGIEDLPEAIQGTAYQARRALAIQAGYATAETLPPDWTPQTAQIVKGFQQNAITAKDQIDLKLKAQQQAQQAINQDRSFGETQRHNVTTEGLTATGQQQTAAYQNAQLVQGQTRLQLEAKRVGLEGQRVGLEGQRIKQQQSTDDPASTLSAGERNMVEQIIKGETKMPPAGSRNSSAARIRAAAFQLDPSLNDERYTVNQSFKAGKDSNDIGSITRVLGHLDQYAKQSDSLGNSAGLLFHLPNSAGIRQTSSAIAEELGKLVKGGALTQTEAAQREHDLMSPIKATRDGAINSIKDLMGSQFEAKFQKYKTATNTDLDPSKFFDKQTQQRLQKQGLTPGGSSSGGPAGVPSVGSVLPNGEKVLKVTRIK